MSDRSAGGARGPLTGRRRAAATARRVSAAVPRRPGRTPATGCDAAPLKPDAGTADAGSPAMADRPLPSSAARLLPLAACALALAVPASADASASLRTTTRLSRAFDGGVPNGPSRHAAVSHDQRIARAIAYESDASDIVRGDVNGAT